MSGGGSSTRQKQTTELSPETSELLRMVTPEIGATMRGAPLSGFTAERPAEIAGLTPEQEEAIRLFSGRMGAPTLTEPESEALAELHAMLQAPAGSSPATLAAMSAARSQWESTGRPEMESALSLAGLGRSGALPYGMAQGEAGIAAATVPLLQQEMLLRAGAVPQMLELGTRMEARPGARATALFDAAEARRQIEQQTRDAEYQDYLRRQGLAESTTTGIAGSLLPSTATIRGQTKTTGGGGMFGS